MTDLPDLRPATPEEIVQTLGFAPRYNGRKRVHSADKWMAKIAAERLLQHLEQSGFLIVKKLPVEPHGAPGYGKGLAP